MSLRYIFCLLRPRGLIAFPRPTLKPAACRIRPGGRTWTWTSFFTTTAPLPQKPNPPRPKPPPEEEIEEFFLKGSGPGGQKINKTNSAVQLRHIPTGIVVKCQATRSREQNRKTARELLTARIDELVNGDQSHSAIVGNLKKKRYDSAAKKARRKYKRLAEEKAESENEDQVSDARTESSPPAV